MKMQDIKSWRNIVFSVMALLAVLFPILGEAVPMGKAGPLVVPLVGKNCVNRSLSDFRKAQGTTSQFFPPVKDYVGWTDGKLITFALVDYAGLANRYINNKKSTGHSLGTTVTGSVIQCELPDGKAQIRVALSTTKALGFAQSIADLDANNWDFLKTPTIFGAKAHDVVKGANSAVGPATLFTTFSISAPGAVLPDLVDVLVNNPANYAPVTLSFMSTTCGRYPDGRKARLDVHEMASTNKDNELVFSVEHVKVVDAQGGNCCN